MKTRTLLTCMLLASSTPVLAQKPDTLVFRVGEIVIQAARPATTVGGASAIEIHIDSLRLPPAPTLEQVLRELPMLHVRTNSRGEAEIVVRGSESRQVALLVDGVPLTLGWDARTDASVIPATAPRQLSLVRGLSSILYGPNTLGGIIEVGIGHGSRDAVRRAELALSVDHVGGYATSATADLPLTLSSGSLLLRGGFGYRDSPGMPLAPDITEPVASDDLRLNTDARQVDGFISARRDWESGRWMSVSASGYDAVRGIAAELNIDAPRLWRYPSASRFVGVVSGGTGEARSPLGGRGDVELSMGYDAGRTEIDQYASHAYDEIIGAEDGNDRTLTLRMRADQSLAARGAWHSALTYADVSHDEFLDPGADNQYRQRLWSAGSELSWSFLDQRLRTSFGGALDGADTPESGDKPSIGSLTDWAARAGVSASLWGDRALAHAGVSRRARFPALRELYSGALGRFEPNPALKPEKLVAAEAGITAKGGIGEVQVVAFYHDLTDAIVRIRTPEKKYQRVNQNETESYGLELLAGAKYGSLSLSGDVTVQDITLHDPTAAGVKPEYQPRVFGGASLRTALPASLSASVGARYTGSQYCIDAQNGGYRELESGTRARADVARTWSLRNLSGWFSRVEASVVVDNVLDATTWDLCALPQPGRLARFQLRLF